MASDDHDLVHFNLAIARHPLDHPAMQGFAAQLEAVNRLAESSPGFIWTPAEGEAGDAIATFGHPMVLANMSTWRTLEDLRRFVYGGLHGAAIARRREWFEPTNRPAYVLWWAQKGRRPKWIDAKERLHRLECEGATAHAFTFTKPFDAEGMSIKDE